MKTNYFNLWSFFYSALFFLVLISTTTIYWSGLSSYFLFDDQPNLYELTTVNSSSPKDIFQFAIEGSASALGRPISLLTFALQAESWPGYPWDFKYVNLMIHLLNGCLVFWFILVLARLLALSESRSLGLAFLTASLWLLHPLQVSTVLYAVQRMTQLSTLFTLVGLLIYLYGRQFLVGNQLKRGFFWISVGVVVGGTLATLSKENGILLVLYIIVLEMTVLRTLARPRYWTPWQGVFLYFPLILLALYFLTHVDNILQAYEIRDFTLKERLLTQASVLTDYLAKILLLRPFGFGLYHDDFVISRNLWTPPMTLVAVSFILGLLGMALWFRRTAPVLAFGILWFFAGQMLESSFIGLMLYFEHRNYLPMLGIIFMTLYGLFKLLDFMGNFYLRQLVKLLAALWFLIFPLITWSQTDLWSKPRMQALFWVQQHPRSMAAHAHAISFFQAHGDFMRANYYARLMTNNFPEHTAPHLYLLQNIACFSPISREAKENLEQIISNVKTTKYEHVAPDILMNILEQRAQGYCSLLDTEMIEKLFVNLLNNPNNASQLALYYYRYAMFHAFERRYLLATEAAKSALKLKDSIRLRLKLLNWLILAKQFTAAEQTLEKIHQEMSPLQINLYQKDIQFLKSKLELFQKLNDKN